jgi:IS5 family transposase
MPKNLNGESYYLKKKREERCRSRAGIEGLISHLKHDHRMIRNYLSGSAGDKINTLLAATAYNMRKWMRLKRDEILNLILRWIFQTLILVPVNTQR